LIFLSLGWLSINFESLTNARLVVLIHYFFIILISFYIFQKVLSLYWASLKFCLLWRYHKIIAICLFWLKNNIIHFVHRHNTIFDMNVSFLLLVSLLFLIPLTSLNQLIVWIYIFIIIIRLLWVKLWMLQSNLIFDL